MKMWSGRFSKELDAGVNDFNSSISFDHVMYREDIARPCVDWIRMCVYMQKSVP